MEAVEKEFQKYGRDLAKMSLNKPSSIPGVLFGKNGPQTGSLEEKRTFFV